MTDSWQTCPECEGRGHFTPGEDYDDEFICSYCGGLGQVFIVANIDDEDDELAT